VLEILRVQYSAGLDIGCTAEQIADANASVCGFTAEEYTRALKSLQGDRLIGQTEDAQGSESLGFRWLLTADGDEFIEAGFPWKTIDRFSSL